MGYNQEEIYGVIVDLPDPDNFAAVQMALYLLGEKVKFVIATGRPAHSNPKADMNQYERWYSERILRLNTRRLKGYLRRAGYGHVPVFEGLIPPSTLVRHDIHVDETVLDIHKDNEYYEGRGEDRTFSDAVRFIKSLGGRLNLIVGGPLTEVAALLRIGEIKAKLGIMTCQLGLFGFNSDITTVAGGGLTFNSAADRDSTEFVVQEYPRELYMVPTDVTKRKDVGFDNLRQRLYANVSGELVQLTGIFYRYLPKGSRIYPHDVHAACLMYQLHGSSPVWNQRWREMHQWTEVRVTGIGERGQISADFDVRVSDRPRRFVVTDVDGEAFIQLFAMGCAQPYVR